jgi:demethylmenaquinone methyltransferase/2-methoxy-6-polyprenyl-1,4-benzoquinol methylase
VPATPRDGSGAMFDGIARRYDALNRVLSFGTDQRWRRRAATALAITDAADVEVLDVATGTADLAIAIAHQLPSARVIGLDPSPAMLEIGWAKIVAADLTARVQLVEGEAERLPFADARFAGATIAFGVRNLPDRARGLAELVRVVRPRGRVVVLELTEPHGVLAPFARAHIHGVVPALGALVGGRAYRHLSRSIARFPPADEFAAELEAAGLELVELRPLTFGVAHVFVGVRR